MDIRVLSRAGLSKGEAEVYLALLKLGPSLVSRVSQSTGLHRTNIYDTLEKLQEKGLAAHVVRENRKYFSASHPSRLLDHLKEREEEVRSLLPELESYLTLPRGESVVELYKGKEGLKTVLKDIVKAGRDYVVFEEEGRIQSVLPHFYAQFNRQLDRAGIKARILTRDARKVARRKGSRLRTLPSYISFPSPTAVYGDKVAIFVWDEPYHAILIRSRAVARGYRSFFESLWRNAE